MNIVFSEFEQYFVPSEVRDLLASDGRDVKTTKSPNIRTQCNVIDTVSFCGQVIYYIEIEVPAPIP